MGRLSCLIAVYIATGRRFGSLTTSPTKVLYISAEDGEQTLQRRLRKICRHMGFEPSDLEGRLHLLDLSNDNAVLFRTVDRGVTGPTQLMNDIQRLAEDLDIGMIVIDNSRVSCGH
ncbi:MAG: AAA family ATPase [Magnetococcus sp. YQC-9]